MIHRIGEHDVRAASLLRKLSGQTREIRPEALLAAVENVCEISRDDFCGSSKGARQIFAKEVLILSGRRLEASITVLPNAMYGTGRTRYTSISV
ncbi:hypothetical protein BH20ACI2_BH20ACI2_04990 [soil metagenome]